jgi:peptidoglycan/xylan/chitin deacetylase (PgdA/CDA1 family)
VAGNIALTYDDGPHPVWTSLILSALEQRGAHATFFVQSRKALQHPDLIATMREGGHEVGFHCLDHVRHSQRGGDGVGNDVEIGLEMLSQLGVRPRAWRAPWGDETQTTRELAAVWDLRLWGWNVDTHDWRGDDAGRMGSALEAQGGLRDGDVILMHDGLGPGALRDGCAATVSLTQSLLDQADELGLTPATVSDCEGVLA